MNRKQFIILLVLVAVIGGAGLIVYQRNNQSWENSGTKAGKKLLPDFDINKVAQIRVQSGTNVLDLAKHDNLWCVAERSDYPANFSKISSLLLKLADLKVVQSEQIGPSLWGRFKLLPPSTSGTNSGTLVEFKNDSGKTLDTLLLGKQHTQKPPANSQYGGWPDGRYVMVGTNSHDVALISDPLQAIQTQPQQWLDKTFLSIQNPSSIDAQFPEATNSWKLVRASKTNGWQLANAKATEKLDSTKISSITSPFRSARFDDVAPIKNFNSTHGAVLTMKTFDGFTYVADIGQKKGDDYPVRFQISADLPAKRVATKGEKPAEKAKLDKAFAAKKARLTQKLANESKLTNWVYMLPSYSVDEILKPRHELLVQPKKKTKPTNTVSKS